MITKKHYLLDTTGKKLIQTQRVCDSIHKVLATQSSPNTSTDRGVGHTIPSLVVELLAMVRSQVRKKQLSIGV